MEAIAILSLFIAILAIILTIFLTSTGFKVSIIPPIKKGITAKKRKLDIRINLCARRGNIAILAIEKLITIYQVDKGCKIFLRDAYKGETINIKDNNGQIFRIEECMPKELIITFKLPTKTSLPFDEITGLKIISSIKTVEKPFIIHWI